MSLKTYEAPICDIVLFFCEVLMGSDDNEMGLDIFNLKELFKG